VHQLKVLERWKEYFIEMFTFAETDQIPDIMDDSACANDLYTEPLTYNKVCTIIDSESIKLLDQTTLPQS
jgi:hypothetical protein